MRSRPEVTSRGALSARRRRQAFDARSNLAYFVATWDYMSTFLYVIAIECRGMSPFSVTVQNVPDRELGPLLTRLSEAGFDDPIIKLAGADEASAKLAARARAGPADLPEDWRLV